MNFSRVQTGQKFPTNLKAKPIVADKMSLLVQQITNTRVLCTDKTQVSASLLSFNWQILPSSSRVVWRLVSGVNFLAAEYPSWRPTHSVQSLKENQINSREYRQKMSYQMKQLPQLTIIIHQLFTTVSSNSITETHEDKVASLLPQQHTTATLRFCYNSITIMYTIAWYS